LFFSQNLMIVEKIYEYLLLFLCSAHNERLLNIVNFFGENEFIIRRKETTEKLFMDQNGLEPDSYVGRNLINSELLVGALEFYTLKSEKYEFLFFLSYNLSLLISEWIINKWTTFVLFWIDERAKRLNEKIYHCL